MIHQINRGLVIKYYLGKHWRTLRDNKNESMNDECFELTNRMSGQIYYAISNITINSIKSVS